MPLHHYQRFARVESNVECKLLLDDVHFNIARPMRINANNIPHPTHKYARTQTQPPMGVEPKADREKTVELAFEFNTASATPLPSFEL